jgi:NDP-sugar pyrophosphorylase family protein
VKVVFLSAGEGLRFRNLEQSSDKPKTLAEIEPGTTVLDVNIEWFHQRGFRYEDMIICILRRHREFYERFIQKGCSISEEDNPSGTAGAVYNARNYIGNEAFIVRNSDTIHLDLDLEKMLELYRRVESPVIALVYRRLPSGYAKVEGERVVEFMEKPLSPYPEYAGTCVFPSTGYFRGDDRYIETEIFPRLAKKGKLYGVISPSEMYFPIDTLKDLLNAREKLINLM